MYFSWSQPMNSKQYQPIEWRISYIIYYDHWINISYAWICSEAIYSKLSLTLVHCTRVMRLLRFPWLIDNNFIYPWLFLFRLNWLVQNLTHISSIVNVLFVLLYRFSDEIYGVGPSHLQLSVYCLIWRSKFSAIASKKSIV